MDAFSAYGSQEIPLRNSSRGCALRAVFPGRGKRVLTGYVRVSKGSADAHRSDATLWSQAPAGRCRFFETEHYLQIARDLKAAIHGGRLIALTAEIGSGKAMLSRCLPAGRLAWIMPVLKRAMADARCGPGPRLAGSDRSTASSAGSPGFQRGTSSRCVRSRPGFRS